MLRPRLITSLLVDRNLHLVKTTRFVERNYIGDPLNAAYIFSNFEVDELIVLDIDASKYSTHIKFDFVKALSHFTTVPLTVGGGIRSIDEIHDLLALGVERIAISESLASNFRFLEEATNRFGSSSISVILNVQKNGRYITKFGRFTSNEDLTTISKRCQDAGAGELVINQVDREGTLSGFDIDLYKSLNAELTIPIVALGGCGNVKHIQELLSATPISGIACGSHFVYEEGTSEVLLNYCDTSSFVNKLFAKS
tara:strand:+ start:776 stop:1537 length:762 start_codon:yes stop_codon:yes gene_type:complete